MKKNVNSRGITTNIEHAPKRGGIFVLALMVAMAMALAPAALTSDADDPTIPHAGMTATATSAQVDNFGCAAGCALDDNADTVWHSRWDPYDPLPVSITIDLGAVYDIGVLRCLPRQDGNSNGMIGLHNIYVGIDGNEFTKVVDNAKWDYDKYEKIDFFPCAAARYVKLEVIGGFGGWASAAEINIERFVDTPPVSGVEVDPPAATMTGYDTLQLTASVIPEDARNKKVSWTSSDPHVVAVGPTGQVSAGNVGTAAITATTTEGGFTAACKITVTAVPVTGISVMPASLGLVVGEGRQMAAVITPANATDKVIVWSSSKPKVATVSAGGYVSTVGAGTTVITGETRDGGKKSGCTLKVTPAKPGVAAARVTDFLGSIGINSSVSVRGETLQGTIDCLKYTGIRWVRAGYESGIPTRDLITIHKQLGVKFSYGLGSGGADLARLFNGARELAKSGALLAFEGPNEPNNWPVTYQGQSGGGSGSWVALAKLMRDLYSNAKNDPVLKDYPVFDIGGESGAQVDNVGLQYLTIPAGADTLMPAGTQYADYANCHNYFCHHTVGRFIDNLTWHASDPIQDKVPENGGHFDGLYGNYGKTWGKGYPGYAAGELSTLPRVTTETGMPIGAWGLTEEMQGRLYLNLYLSQFKRGWSYTSIYLLRDRSDESGNQQFGFYQPDYTPRKAAVYLHNLTTILADDGAIPAPGRLKYSIDNQPATVHDLLLEKSNGKFYLVVWGERYTTGGSDKVTVNLGTTWGTVKIYDPTAGALEISAFSKVRAIDLTLSDHPLIIELD